MPAPQVPTYRLVTSLRKRVSRALRSWSEADDALQTRDRTHTAFATVPDQRCTASLSLALHRIRDKSHLILGPMGQARG